MLTPKYVRARNSILVNTARIVRSSLSQTSTILFAQMIVLSAMVLILA